MKNRKTLSRDHAMFYMAMILLLLIAAINFCAFTLIEEGTKIDINVLLWMNGFMFLPFFLLVWRDWVHNTHKYHVWGPIGPDEKQAQCLKCGRVVYDTDHASLNFHSEMNGCQKWHKGFWTIKKSKK